jgi:hypothetical protein
MACSVNRSKGQGGLLLETHNLAVLVAAAGDLVAGRDGHHWREHAY